MDSALLSQPSIDKIDQLNQQAWDIRIIDSNKAHELSMEAFQLSKATGYAKGEAEGLRTLGFCLIRLSKHDEAYARLNEALAIF